MFFSFFIWFPVRRQSDQGAPRVPNRGLFADFDVAVQRGDDDAAVAVTLGEFKLQARCILARAPGLVPETVVDVAVERLYLEFGRDSSRQGDLDVAIQIV